MEGGTKDDLKILDIDPKELETDAMMAKAESAVGKNEAEVKSGEEGAGNVGMAVSFARCFSLLLYNVLYIRHLPNGLKIHDRIGQTDSVLLITMLVVSKYCSTCQQLKNQTKRCCSLIKEYSD